MYTQLSRHAAEAHHQDLLRAAQAARVADELPRKHHLSHLGQLLARTRFGSRRASVATPAVEVSPSV